MADKPKTNLFEDIRKSSDKRLALLCLENERIAWEEFFRRFIPLIKREIQNSFTSYGFYSFANDIDRIAEIQLLLVSKLYSDGALKQCHNYSGLQNWLSIMVRNQVVDWLRNQGRKKRLPERQLEQAMLSFSTNLYEDSGLAIEDTLGCIEKPANELSEIDRKFDYFLSKIIDSIPKIKNPKSRWTFRLSLMAYLPVLTSELDQLVAFGSFSEDEILIHLRNMKTGLRAKAKRRDKENARAILYWYEIRRLQAILSEKEKIRISSEDEEIRTIQSKIDKLNQKRQRLLSSANKIIKPKNSEIAELIGIDKDQARQITNLFNRARKEILKLLPEVDFF